MTKSPVSVECSKSHRIATWHQYTNTLREAIQMSPFKCLIVEDIISSDNKIFQSTKYSGYNFTHSGSFLLLINLFFLYILVVFSPPCRYFFKFSLSVPSQVVPDVFSLAVSLLFLLSDMY